MAGYLQLVATGFDRVILLHRGGVEAVGYYAPAVAVLGALGVVPGAVATYVYPRMSYALGQGQRPRTARAHGALAPRRSRSRRGLPVAVAGWIAAPPAIERFFPQYVASVPAVRWSLVAGVLWGFTSLTTLFGSLKAWRSLALYIGVLLAARWTLPWLLSRSEPLVGVARGNACAAAVVGGLSLLLAVPRLPAVVGGGVEMTAGSAAWDPPLVRPHASEQAVFAVGKLCLLAFLAAQFVSLTRLFFVQHLGRRRHRRSARRRDRARWRSSFPRS